MSKLSTIFYEWKHFVRSPFKIVALILFVLAGIYGLHNGAGLYDEHVAEIERIHQKTEEDRQEYLSYYSEGKRGPEDRPWVDISTPFWAIWYSGVYHFKAPSPALVYGIGQAEQYGFYKRITFGASPYDADMTQEIANPERLQTGTLDFTFALLFLLPLSLLILIYDLKTIEADQGFLSLIEIQTTSIHTWLFSRIIFYVSVLYVAIIGLLLYGAVLTDLFSSARAVFSQMALYSFLYLAFWAIIFWFLLTKSSSVMDSTLKMVGVWLLFAFVIPAAVQQWVSIKKTVNLMTDLIDARRDKQQELYALPDSVFEAKLVALFPEILSSPAAKDSLKRKNAYSRSASALVNELVKNSLVPIVSDNNAKNEMIRSSFWFSPVSFFQNRFNIISQTHYDDYQDYRDAIQGLIDKQIRIMVLETWENRKVDENKYLDYHTLLTES